MSLRSRIRGGHDCLSVIIATAAQFLTLRLILIGSTHVGCDDSDGPGHAPRYLDVSDKMNKRTILLLSLVLLVMTAGIMCYGYIRSKMDVESHIDKDQEKMSQIYDAARRYKWDKASFTKVHLIVEELTKRDDIWRSSWAQDANSNPPLPPHFIIVPNAEYTDFEVRSGDWINDKIKGHLVVGK